MKHGATFLVMRCGPLLGYTAGHRLTTVAYRAYSLAEALTWLSPARREDLRLNRYWVAKVGQPAHRRRPRKGPA